MSGVLLLHSWLAYLTWLLLTVGCMGAKNDSSDGSDSDSDPAIEVTPQYLDFGVWSEGDGALQEEFTIRSVGGSDLEVINVEISGYAAGTFSLVGGSVSLTLPPETEEVIGVEFEPPNAGEHSANVIVTSETDNPKTAVELSGTTEEADEGGDTG